jgi:hypothetical protein
MRSQRRSADAQPRRVSLSRKPEQNLILAAAIFICPPWEGCTHSQTETNEVRICFRDLPALLDARGDASEFHCGNGDF